MKNRQLLKYFFLFVVALLLFSYFQHFPTFPDPDSFYHAKMAVLIRDQGIVKDFPWLEFTVLKNYYVDHHFLYHVLLIPFVSFFDPLVGIKLATATFAALLILFFFWFLEKSKIKGAFFYSLLLLTVSPFIFRINLAKASSVSIIILIFGLYFILNKKYWLLFILSFIYVWTYGGWPLILVLSALYIIADSIIRTADQFKNSGIMNYESGIRGIFRNWKLGIINFIKNIFARENLKLFFSCFGGLMAGIVVNPYFPKNLFFYWQQIIQIAIINYQSKIGVGAEWYPYNLGDLIASSSFVFVLLIIASAAFYINFIQHLAEQKKSEFPHEEKIKILFFTLLAIFFLALTLRSRRNVEYFVPFAVLFAAFSLNFLNQSFSLFKKYWLTFQNWSRRRKTWASVLYLYVLILLPFTIGHDLWSVKKLFASGYPADKYKGVSEWLAKNTPAGSIVFHNDWDDFPPLFYYNTHNRYIAGLDPTFMYEYDKDLYKKWVDITTGKQDNISQIIKNEFHSDYVFVDKDHIALENNLKRDGNFQMVYKDDEGKIYQLIYNP